VRALRKSVFATPSAVATATATTVTNGHPTARIAMMTVGVWGRRGRDSNPSSGVGDNFKRHATLHANARKLGWKWFGSLSLLVLVSRRQSSKSPSAEAALARRKTRSRLRNKESKELKVLHQAHLARLQLQHSVGEI